MLIEIYVISHKKYNMPDENEYLPLQVGLNSEDFKGFFRDNTGKNIARKNLNYCELTGQFWAWKNRQADIKGIVHYRRLFSNVNGIKGRFQRKILKKEKIKKLLKTYDFILPKKRNYYIETLWSHYEHSHNIEGLIVTKKIIMQEYPEYANSFTRVLNRRKAHMFNMFITNGELFNEYSEWLFSILKRVEENIDISNYNSKERRIFGYISELLLDVWLDFNNYSYIELPVIFVEGENYLKKGFNLVKRKYVKKGE